MFRLLTFMAALALPLSANAASSVTLSECTTGSAKLTYTVDTDDVLVVWDGSDEDNSVQIPVNSEGVASELKQDFAEVWGGSSNSSISVYLLSSSSIASSCSN